MIIPKEDALYKTRPISKKMPSCVSLFSKSSWIKTIASRLTCELGVNGEKKSMETGQFYKPGNFNSLREIIWIITVTLKVIEDESQCQNKCSGY